VDGVVRLASTVNLANKIAAQLAAHRAAGGRVDATRSSSTSSSSSSTPNSSSSSSSSSTPNSKGLQVHLLVCKVHLGSNVRELVASAGEGCMMTGGLCCLAEGENRLAGVGWSHFIPDTKKYDTMPARKACC
jgi:hypothetical protein